jgi:hypothetical protein
MSHGDAISLTSWRRMIRRAALQHSCGTRLPKIDSELDRPAGLSRVIATRGSVWLKNWRASAWKKASGDGIYGVKYLYLRNMGGGLFLSRRKLARTSWGPYTDGTT